MNGICVLTALVLCLLLSDFVHVSCARTVRERRRACKRHCTNRKDKDLRKRCVKECVAKANKEKGAGTVTTNQEHKIRFAQLALQSNQLQVPALSNNFKQATSASSPSLEAVTKRNHGTEESTVSTPTDASDDDWILYSDDSEYTLLDNDTIIYDNDSVIIDPFPSDCPWHCGAEFYYGPWPGDVGAVNLSCVINRTRNGNDSIIINVSWDPPTENFKYLHGYRVMWSTYTNIIHCICIDGDDNTHFTLKDGSGGWTYPGVVGFLVKPVPTEDFNSTEFLELNPLANCTYVGATEEEKSTSLIPSDKVLTAVAASLGGMVIVAALGAAYIYFKKPQPDDTQPIQIQDDNQSLQVYMMYYAHNQAVKDRVASITTWLLTNGINAVMNLMHTTEIAEISDGRWSRQQIERADKVLLICTPEFLSLCHQHDSGNVRGADPERRRTFFEIGLLKNEQYRCGLCTTKFVLLKMTGAADNFPSFLSHYQNQAFNWSDRNDRERLLFLLRGVNEYI